MDHAGNENGNLICTCKQLEGFGIGPRFVHLAVADAIKRGLIDRTVEGKASSGADRFPARYALGWLPRHDGASASNRWKAWSTPPALPAPNTLHGYMEILKVPHKREVERIAATVSPTSQK
jgi:hypothetical protein